MPYSTASSSPEKVNAELCTTPSPSPLMSCALDALSWKLFSSLTYSRVSSASLCRLSSSRAIRFICVRSCKCFKKKKEIESKLLQQTFAYFSHQSYGLEGKRNTMTTHFNHCSQTVKILFICIKTHQGCLELDSVESELPQRRGGGEGGVGKYPHEGEICRRSYLQIAPYRHHSVTTYILAT